MKKYVKRVLSIWLLLCIVVTAVPAMKTSAETVSTGESLNQVFASKVEVSSAHSSWGKSYLIDGVVDTSAQNFWSTGDRFQTSEIEEYASFTMEAKTNVYYVDLYPRTDKLTSLQNFPKDFTVQVSEDGNTWEVVATYTGYTHPDKSQALRVLVDKDNVGYVKLDVTKSSSTTAWKYVQLSEVMFYAKAPQGDKLSFSATETSTAHGSCPTVNLTDGNTSTFWSTKDYGANVVPEEEQYAKVTLAEKTSVSCVELYPRSTNALFPKAFAVKVSEDGEIWETVATYTDYTRPTASDGADPLCISVNKENVMYIQIDITEMQLDGTRYYAQMSELAAYGVNEDVVPSKRLAKAKISSVETATTNTTWVREYLINGNLADMWSSNEYTAENVTEYAKLTLEKKEHVYYIDLYPRTAQGVFCCPIDFTVSVSEDGDTWEMIQSYTSYSSSNESQPLRVLVDKENIQYVKVDFMKVPAQGTRYYVQMAEVEVISLLADETKSHVEQMNLATYTSVDGEGVITRTVPKAQKMLYTDWIFAGWYQDADCTKAVSSTTTSGTYYAKFLPSAVLSVKCQALAGTTADSTDTKLRFISTVDCLKYSAVGFDITYNDREIPYETDTVFTEIVAKDGGVVYTESPSVFHQLSEYFNTVTLIDIPKENFEKTIVVKPYWITLDGTKVYGVTRNVTVAESYTTSNN